MHSSKHDSDNINVQKYKKNTCENSLVVVEMRGEWKGSGTRVKQCSNDFKSREEKGGMSRTFMEKRAKRCAK